MNIVSPYMRRPFTVLVLVAAVILGSLLALRETPRDIFPTLGIPTIHGGMDPAQMEGCLTYYYEYHKPSTFSSGPSAERRVTNDNQSTNAH